MRKGTLARIEINVGVVVFAIVIVLAGYGLVSALVDRIDPKVRECVAHAEQIASAGGKNFTRDEAVKFCKHLEAIGAL
jgi:hypothetical protein